MRHHRKLLRRLRALFPREQRRGVVIERTRQLWRVMRPLRIVVAGECLSGRGAMAESVRRADALQEALRKRARETKGDTT